MISVVVVTHNSADVITECLASLPQDVEVIVVDNASEDNGAAVVEAAYPRSTLLREQTNRGFGAGCNIGAHRASGDVLIFLNPDTVVEEPALDTLAQAVRHGRQRVVGPALLDVAGNVRHVARRRTTVIHEVTDLVPALRGVLPTSWRRDLPPTDPIYRYGGRVAYVQGACIAVSRSTFEEVGGFDEAFFLYSEEEDFCDRVTEIGGTAMYEPRARVRHLWGASTQKAGSVPAFHRFRSAVLLQRKRGARMHGLLVAVVLLVAVIVRFLGVALCHVAGRSIERGLRWTVAAGKGSVAGVATSSYERRRPGPRGGLASS